MALPPQQQPQQQVESFDDLVPDSGPQNFDELIALQQQELAAPDDMDRQINEQVAYLDNLLYGAQQRREEAPIKTPEPVPDRGLFMEALAGIGSGALGTLGSGLSGIERIAERLEIDPTGDDAGWFRQAGEAMKKGAEEIKASPDKEIYFKTFNAFGSILGFAAPAVVAAPFSGIAALGIGATLAAGTGADEAYDRAIEGKATEEQIDQSVGLGTALGLTEILAPIKIIKSLGKVMPDWDFTRKFINKDGLNTTSTEELINKTTKEAQSGRLNKILSVNDTGIKEFAKRVGSTVGLEGSQEFLAAVGQNAIERYIYKPDADLLNADAIEEGLYGGGAGGMLQGIVSTFSMRKSRQYRKKMEKFLESDEYGQIRTEAEQASDQIEEADARIKELQEKDEVFFPSAKSTKKQIENAVRDREKAGIRLQRANALAEKALNDKVYTSNEVLSYLSGQVDEDGRSLYSPEYLKSLQKSDREKGTSYLKAVYSGHVQDTRTKHEQESEEKFLNTINTRATIENGKNKDGETIAKPIPVYNTIDEVEQVKEGRTPKQFEVEVDARIEDSIKHPDNIEVQDEKLILRKGGLSVQSVNNLFDNFSIEDSNNKYLNSIKYILLADKKNIKQVTEIINSDKKIGLKKNNINNLAKKIRKDADAVIEAKKVADQKKTQAEKQEDIIAETKSKEEQDRLAKESDNYLTEQNKTLEGNEELGDVQTEEGVDSNTAQQEITDVQNTEASDIEKNAEIFSDDVSREELAVETKPIQEEISTAVTLIDIPDKNVVETKDQDNIKDDIEGRLFSVIEESYTDIDGTYGEVSAELVDYGFDASDIVADIKQFGSGYTTSLDESLKSIPENRNDLRKAASALTSRIKKRLRDDKIENKDLDVIRDASNAEIAETYLFSISEKESIESIENEVDPILSEMGPVKYRELANAVATMLGVAGSSKIVDRVLTKGSNGGREYIYKFKNLNDKDISVVFKNIPNQTEGNVRGGLFNLKDGTITIDPNVLTWSDALGVTAHESFHAAKRLLFKNTEVDSVFETVLSRDMARKNGWQQSKYEEFFDKVYKKEEGATKEVEDARLEKIGRLLNEEAQAYIYEQWYKGENIVGLTPPARNLFSIMRDFFRQFNNYIRRQVLNQDVEVKEDLNKVVLGQMRDMASGELARRAGALPPANAANLAAEHIPENTESILKATWAEITRGAVPVGKDKNGNDIMRDITVLGRIFSHLSAVSERSESFKKFYNKLQDRIALRNSIKQTAEIFLEKIGPYSGIFRLSNSDFVEVQKISLFADEANQDPVFENEGTEQATATVTITESTLDMITKRYQTLSNFYSDLGIKEGDVTSFQDGDVIKYQMRLEDPRLANAYAGSHTAIKHVGENVYAGLIHNFLNQPALKETNIKIRTKGVDGSGKNAYRTAINDFNDLKKELKANGLLDSEGKLDSAAYENYQKEMSEQGVPAEDRVFGGLSFGDKGGLNIGADKVWTVLEAITADKRSGYFPHYRYGSHVAAVYDISGNLVRMESAESAMAERLGNVPVIGDRARQGVLRKQDELVKELQTQFGSNYTVEPLQLTLEAARIGNDRSKKTIIDALGKLNVLSEAYTRRSTDQEKIQRVNTFVDMIKAEAIGSRVDSLVRDRKNVPGYISKRNNDGRYYKQAIQRYVDEGSNTASSLFEEPELLEAKEEIAQSVQGGIDSNLYRLADKTFDYVNNPNNEATFLRSYAFHMFLGFNFSSAVVNLTQTVQATYPILSSITGMTKGTTGLIKASADAVKLSKHMTFAEKGDAPRLGKYGFEFFTTEVVDGEPTVVIDPKRKPSWMADDEFQMLAKLFQKGTIQPIQNMDLGAGILSQSLDKPVARTLADSSGFAFGYVENLNRITAALSFYRAAKRDAQNNNRDKFNAFASSTRFSEPLVDDSGNSIETDTEEGINAFAERMAEMGVEKTQFFMGKENRPTLFRGPVMSAVTQFQSFLFQMVGTYATAFRTSVGAKLDQYPPEEAKLLASMARKQLGMMTMTMMAFGGAMGLPFMENFKELFKFITENFGDEVGEDLEAGTREVLGPILGYNATDMLLRGLPRSLGIDISRRTGYGDVIPLRLLMGGDPVDFAGPGIARLADQAQGINNAMERSTGVLSTVGNLAHALAPIGFGNAIEGFISEPTRGTLTRRGQQLLPAGTLSNSQRVARALGFTPTQVSRARERKGMENYYQYRSKNGKERYTNRMAVSLSNYIKSMQEGDFDTAMDNYQEYLKDYLHVMNHDLDNMSTPSKQYNINPSTIEKRAMRAQDPMGVQTSSRVRKSVRPEIQRLIQEGVIPSDE